MALAAMGASEPIYQLLVGFALGIGSGMSLVVARSYGSGDLEKLKRTVAGSVIIGLAVTAGTMLLPSWPWTRCCACWAPRRTSWSPPWEYIATITLFVGVMFAYNLCSGLLRAVGNSMTPLVFLVISSLLNIALDLLLVGPMGVRGVAVATVIAQGGCRRRCAWATSPAGVRR